MNGDPLGIAPYAVTKWAAQSNADLGASAVVGIADNRGGTHVGFVNATTAPTRYHGVQRRAPTRC